MTKQDFIEKVRCAAADCGMDPAQGPVLVALSGGADSVALLHVLRALDFPVEAVHCNFELRGAESDRDEAFVRSLCRRLGVELHVTHFRTRQHARRNGISVEMAARELRYAYFDRLRQERRAGCVAVAHHRDDNVETLLLNLVRGTGIHGLTGMAPRNGHVVRPLLGVSRADVEAYLAELGQDYVTDSTNLQDEVQRNKIRLNILPQLGEINPAVADTLQATAMRLAGVAAYYDWAIERARQRVCRDGGIDKEALRNEPAPQALLYEILSGKGFNPAQISEIYEHMDGEPGRVYESDSWRLLRDRDALLLRSKADRFECLCPVLPLQGTVRVAPGITFVIRREAVGPGFDVPRQKHTACFDVEKLAFPLTVRRVQEGDRFVPFGMKGSRLVSDFLTDAKKSLFDKERQLVVCSGDRIAWLVGERPDDRFRLDEHTRYAMILKLERF